MTFTRNTNLKNNAKTQCEFTQSNGLNGFCTRDGSCCRGTTVNNLCNEGMVCCYGRYDCPSNSNQNQRPNVCPNIISRNSWRARNPLKALSNTGPVNHVFVHHTEDGNTCDDQNTCSTRLRSLQSYHQLNKRWDDIAWNFVIGGDGQVYEGVGWNREGYHTLNWNQRSIGIALIGDFNDRNPRNGMLDALEDIISCGVRRGNIRSNYRLHGHRDVLPETRCPGDNLYRAIRQMDNFQSGPLNN